MQYVAKLSFPVVLFLTFLQSVAAIELSPGLDRSPAIVGPPTEGPVGDQAELYREYLNEVYRPASGDFGTDSTEQPLQPNGDDARSEAFHT